MRIAIISVIALLAANAAVSMVVVPTASDVAVPGFFGTEFVVSGLDVNSSITSEISLGSNLAAIGFGSTDWLGEVDRFEAVDYSIGWSGVELFDFDAIQGNLSLKDIGSMIEK